MSQQEIDEAVASATGERVGVIKSRGFSMVDSFATNFDPEPRGPMVLDWDTMCPKEWAD